MLPWPAAIIRIAPRIGPIQGDQPAPKPTPIMKDEVTEPGVPGSSESRRSRSSERNPDQAGLVESEHDQHDPPARTSIHVFWAPDRARWPTIRPRPARAKGNEDHREPGHVGEALRSAQAERIPADPHSPPRYAPDRSAQWEHAGEEIERTPATNAARRETSVTIAGTLPPVEKSASMADIMPRDAAQACPSSNSWNGGALGWP